jgi:hypothetical protein
MSEANATKHLKGLNFVFLVEMWQHFERGLRPTPFKYREIGRASNGNALYYYPNPNDYSTNFNNIHAANPRS